MTEGQVRKEGSSTEVSESAEGVDFIREPRTKNQWSPVHCNCSTVASS